jgi:Predicted nucleic acid-binding protein, contains PIN domain
MTAYLIDTNILIYYLAGALVPEEKPTIDTILQESFNISIITRIELLGWKGHTPEGLVKAGQLLDCARCLPLTDTLAEKTIDIRRYASISLPDAVIAASAQSLDAILVTRNEKDFVNVNGLRIYNPFRQTDEI